MKSFKEFLNQVNERYEHDEELKLIDNPELVKYAEGGNLDKVKELLDNRVNPDSKNNNDNTAAEATIEKKEWKVLSRRASNHDTESLLY